MRNSTKFVLSLAMAFGLLGGAKAVNHTFVVNTGNTPGANQWDKSVVYTLGSNLEVGHTYTVKASVYAETPLEVDFNLWIQNNNGSKNTQYLAAQPYLTSSPTVYEWNFTVASEAEAPEDWQGFGPFNKLNFNFGKYTGKIYIDNVSCIESGSSTEMVTNGDFEVLSFANWANNGGNKLSIEADYVAGQDGYILFDGSKGSEVYSKQGVYTLSTPTEADKRYCVSIKCKAENPDGESDFVLWPKKSSDGSSFYGMAAFKLTNEFKTYSWWFIPGEGFDKLTFQMGKYDGKIYIDDVTCREAKTDEWVIIGDEMVTNGSFSYPGLYGWSVDGSATMFRDVYTKSVDVTAAGWATFSTDKALDLANISGGTAYIVADQTNNGSVTLTEANTAVPANTGLLIKCEGGGTVTIPVANSGVAPTTNYLVASDGTTEVGINNYVFAYENGTFANPGFYQLTEETTVPTGKAYLSSDVILTQAKAFLPFDGTATEVQAPVVAETEEDEVLYNMAGIQVDKNFKGFVVNQKGVKRFNR